MSRRVEDAHQRRADVVGAPPARPAACAGELEQVVALVERQPQRAGDRADICSDGRDPRPLLEPRVEVGRHVRERRDLLAPQAGRPPARGRAEADVLGLQRRAPAAQEVGESVAVHARHDGDREPRVARDSLSLAEHLW